MSRTFRIVLATTAALMLVALVAGGIVLWRLTDIAGAMAEGALAARGLEGASVKIERIGLDELRLGPIRLDAAGRVAARGAVVRYRLAHLLQGRLDGAEIEGLRLEARLTTEGVSLGPLDTLLAASVAVDAADGGGEPALALIGDVEMKDARVRLATPLGPLDLKADGRVSLTENLGTVVKARLGVDHAEASLVGDLAFAWASSAVNAAFDIHEGNSRAEQLSFDAIKARLRFEGPGFADGTLFADGWVRGLGSGTARLGDARLEATLAEGRLAGHFDLEGQEQTGVVLRLDIDTDDLRQADAGIRVAGDAASPGFKGTLPVDIAGQAGFYLEGGLASLKSAAAMFTDGAALAPEARFEAQLDAAFLDLALPASGSELSLAGTVDVAARDGTLSVVLTEPLSVEAAAGGRRHSLTLKPVDEKSPLLTLGPTLGDAYVLATLFEARPAGLPRLAGRVGGRALLDDGGRPFIEAAELNLATIRHRIDGLALALSGLNLKLAGALGALDGSLSAGLAVSGTGPGGVRLDGLRASLSGALSQRGQVVSFRPEACAGIKVRRLETAGLVLKPGPTKLCPPATGDGVAAQLDLAAKGGPKVKLRFNLTPGAFSLAEAGAGTGAVSWHGTLPRLALSAEGGLGAAAAGWRGSAEVKGGEVIADGLQLELGGIDLKAEFKTGGKVAEVSASLLGARLADRRRPQLFLPVGLAGKARLNGPRATFQLIADLAPGAAVEANGSHDLDAGRGVAALVLPAITLDPKGLALEKLTPLGVGLVTDVAGRIEADGRFAWSGDGLTSSGRVKVSNLSAATSVAQIAGVAGEARFSDLLALKTDKEQRLKIGFLDAGLPLTDGEIVYALDGDDTVRLLSARWPFAGGRIGAAGITIGFDGKVPDIDFGVDGIDLARLLKLADIAGLEGGGKLTGVIPLRMEKDGPAIRDAKVESMAGGNIRYHSAEAAAVLAQGGNSGEILAKALDDFQYSRLNFTFDGPLSGEIRARASLAGNNPGVYDGKRIELNVDLQGDLRDLVQSGSVINDLPENIRKRLAGGG